MVIRVITEIEVFGAEKVEKVRMWVETKGGMFCNDGNPYFVPFSIRGKELICGLSIIMGGNVFSLWTLSPFATEPFPLIALFLVEK